MKTRNMQWMAAGAVALVALCGATGGVAAEKVTCRVELDRGVLPAGSAQKAVIKITLDAPAAPKTERPPVNLAIVLDRSGSMGGEKLERAKQGAIEAVRRLGPRDRFSLVAYDDQIETIVPAQGAGNIEWVENRIRGIQAGNSTALFGGVSQGAAELRKNIEGHFVNRMILLSDGLANVGPSQPADLARLGAALAKENIAVSTVGVGNDYNEDLMTRLSQNSGGNAYYVRESAELPKLFAAELGDVLSVVARRVVLEIVCPDGVKPLRIIGRDGRIHGNRIEVDLSQLCGGQSKYALVEVEVPSGRPSEERPIATAKCTYENVVNQCTESAGGHVAAHFSDREPEVVKSANAEVQVEYFRNRAAETRDEAVKMVDQGKPADAAEYSARNAAELKQEATKYGVGDKIRQDLEVLSNDAQVIRDNRGLPSASRKAMRTDSYQMRNQQSVDQNISVDMMRAPAKQ